MPQLSHTTLKRVLAHAAARTDPVLIQRNPYFPDLLNQPDVLIVPKLGKLIAVYSYMQRKRLAWRTMLPAIEDLFELKLATGESTVAIAVMEMSVETHPADNHLLGLIAGMFDFFIPITTREDFNEDQLTVRIEGAIHDVRPKEEYFELWTMERARVARELKRFSEARYVELVDERRQRQAKRRDLTVSLQAAARQTKIADSTILDFRVPTPKEAMAGLPERNQFVFDMGLRSTPTRPTMAIDFVSIGRYGSRPTLRYLMTKARFTSYEPGRARFELAYRGEPIRPVLLVDGNLAGPSHDPYRYIRALISAGWEVDKAEPETLLRLANANF